MKKEGNPAATVRNKKNSFLLDNRWNHFNKALSDQMIPGSVTILVTARRCAEIGSLVERAPAADEELATA